MNLSYWQYELTSRLATTDSGDKCASENCNNAPGGFVDSEGDAYCEECYLKMAKDSMP